MFDIGELAYYESRLVQIEECDGTCYRVRIQAGHEGAGQLMQIHPDHLIKIEPDPVQEVIEPSKSDKIKKWAIHIFCALIFFALVFFLLQAQKLSDAQKKVNDLHKINTEDSADIEIIREAQKRIADRKNTKSKLIQEIGYGQY